MFRSSSPPNASSSHSSRARVPLPVGSALAEELGLLSWCSLPLNADVTVGLFGLALIPPSLTVATLTLSVEALAADLADLSWSREGIVLDRKFGHFLPQARSHFSGKTRSRQPPACVQPGPGKLGDLFQCNGAWRGAQRACQAV